MKEQFFYDESLYCIRAKEQHALVLVHLITFTADLWQSSFLITLKLWTLLYKPDMSSLKYTFTCF
jgi:hypothetical protein